MNNSSEVSWMKLDRVGEILGLFWFISQWIASISIGMESSAPFHHLSSNLQATRQHRFVLLKRVSQITFANKQKQKTNPSNIPECLLFKSLYFNVCEAGKKCKQEVKHAICGRAHSNLFRISLSLVMLVWCVHALCCIYFSHLSSIICVNLTTRL
jgi:hypothetical protein